MGWEPPENSTYVTGNCPMCGEFVQSNIPHECGPRGKGQPSEGIGELIERLMIANMKLWAVCDKKANAANMSQEDLRVLVADDLNLCKSRAAIRAEINRRLGSASGETVKHYGAAPVYVCNMCGESPCICLKPHEIKESHSAG